MESYSILKHEKSQYLNSIFQLNYTRYGIVQNWSGTNRALVKYPGETLGLGIYSKQMRPIQESVSKPIRVIPNKSEASFNPYQSEAHLKSIRTLIPNESSQSESVQTFNPNESEIDRIHRD